MGFLSARDQSIRRLRKLASRLVALALADRRFDQPEIRSTPPRGYENE